MSARPRVLSGIQPTSDSFHIGNYLGALRNWVALQDTHDAFYCVVDLHAITAPQEPAALRRRSRASAAQLLALGLDPQRCTLFAQSHVPEHAELGWILSCITGMGEAGRMTQYKDKAAKGGADAASVGLFTYPILQAGDILMYHADLVPVGEDQRQHLELTRDLAQRFNHRFGATFTVPEAYVPKDTPKVLDLQDPMAKMSKSSPAGCLDLLEDPASLVKKVRRAVTDAGSEVVADATRPGVTNLLTIWCGITGESLPDAQARFAGSGYGEFKAALADALVEFVRPIQERYRQFDDETVDGILADGAERARAVAAATMADVRERVGFVPAKDSGR